MLLEVEALSTRFSNLENLHTSYLPLTIGITAALRELKWFRSDAWLKSVHSQRKDWIWFVSLTTICSIHILFNIQNIPPAMAFKCRLDILFQTVFQLINFDVLNNASDLNVSSTTRLHVLHFIHLCNNKTHYLNHNFENQFHQTDF